MKYRDMKYHEEYENSVPFKANYVDSIEALLSKRKEQFEQKRRAQWPTFFENQESYRQKFIEMLGWPLVYEPDKDELPSVEIKKLSDEDGYSIYRMEFDIIDGCILTGLFFKQDTDEKRPLIITQHGGDGTPELISGFYEGKTYNYNDMVENVIKGGAHIFAPQLLLWSEQYGLKQERNRVDAELKRLGGSITALEIYAIRRILDYFETKDYVKNFGMVGVSYGGFYTLYTAAIDTRIESAVSGIFFNKRDAVPWSDWTWFKSAEVFEDAEVAALVYPRKLYIQIADKDNLFNYKYGLESYERLKELSEKVGLDWVDFVLFDGAHEFWKEDVQVQKMINDLL